MLSAFDIAKMGVSFSQFSDFYVGEADPFVGGLPEIM
jgi:hypothetical protein